MDVYIVGCFAWYLATGHTQGSAFFACANRYNCTVLRMKITNLRKGLSGGIRDR